MVMSTTLVCQNCGAPWRPLVTGACRFCGFAAPPPGAPVGVTGARPVVDGDALWRLLIALTTDPSQPLDRLAGALRAIAGDRAIAASGSPVDRLRLTLDDWQYEAWQDRSASGAGGAGGDVSALAVHTVRGVVLKRQPLPFDEWMAALAGHLAEYAGTHHHTYDAIVALDRQDQDR
jgi:hypothetical protein